jgi:hypothetical protein
MLFNLLSFKSYRWEGFCMLIGFSPKFNKKREFILLTFDVAPMVVVVVALTVVVSGLPFEILKDE